MFFETDDYSSAVELPPELIELAGPNGVAMVRAYTTGKTDPGWGEQAFMKNYLNGKFSRTAPWNKPFAIVMRSLPLTVIDIDGKNGGFAGIKDFGALPPTLAETSKSGNGYHLYYYSHDDWSKELGFAEFNDHIGVALGVDTRSTGCVFHYPQQRWNNRPIAELPQKIRNMLRTANDRAEQTKENIARMKRLAAEPENDIDYLATKHMLLQDLAQPIKVGKRNLMLYVYGTKLHALGVDDWEELITNRAIEVGLERSEINKLLKSIAKQ